MFITDEVIMYRRSFMKLIAGGALSMTLPGCSHSVTDPETHFLNRQLSLTPTPPLGWNSYDSYACAINEGQVRENLDVFEEKLLPHGYEYFVIDDGWQGGHNPVPNVNVDEYGRCIPVSL